MHITDVPTEQPCSAGGGLVLPLPVADIEGHFDRQLVLLDFIEEPLERLDTATVQGLVVLYQQLHGTVAEQAGEGLQVAVVGEVTQ
ncbi:hypothetical protein D3C86_2026420 [compost metagenome]